MQHKIKTFEDACQALGIDPAKLPDVSMLPEQDGKALLANYKLTIIARALNEGWTPDWDNNSWDKYYPWFWMSSSRGFSLGVVGRGRVDSGVGSRLCYKSEELAEYAATQFIELYRDYYVME